MELRRYATILWRRRLLIALAMVVAMAFTAATAERTITYTARSTIYVGANSFAPDDGDTNLSGDQATGLGQVIRTFATMIVSTSVAAEAIDLTGVPRSPSGVVSSTSATQIPGTNILAIEVRDPDPAIAQTLATGMAQAFVGKIAEIEPGQPLREGDVPRAPAQIFERATVSTNPTSTPLLSALFVAAFVGFVGSSALVLLAEYLDITVKSPIDAEQRLNLPVLGVVPVLALDPRHLSRHLRAAAEAELETADA